MSYILRLLPKFGVYIGPGPFLKTNPSKIGLPKKNSPEKKWVESLSPPNGLAPNVYIRG